MTRTLSTNIYPRSEHCLQTASDWWEGSEQPILRLAHDADVFSIWQNAFMIVTMSLLKVLTDSPEPEIDVSCWPELLFQVMQRCRQNTLQPADLISLNFSFKRCVLNSRTTRKPKSWSLPRLLGHDPDNGGHMTTVNPCLRVPPQVESQGLIIYQQFISDRDDFSPSTCFQTWLITCKTRRNFKHGSSTDGKQAPLGYKQRGCPDLTHQSCVLEQTPHLLT